MGSEPPPAAAPAAKPPWIPSTATTTTATLATAVDGTTTTISFLGQEQLPEIFLRLPNLPSLVRAALACRSWLGAVRSSPSFRRLFRDLHPAPLVGIFLEPDGISIPDFVPVRRSDPDVAAALHRGDFFLTSLPAEDDASPRWDVADCHDGYVLLWDMLDGALAALNPITWALDYLPLPPADDIRAEARGDFDFLGFHLLSSDEAPWSFRVVCLCVDDSRVRAAVFSSETGDWVVNHWVELEIGADYSIMFKSGALVDGSVYWPIQGDARMVRVNAATMDITTVDLPSRVKVDGYNFKAGETKDGALYIVYESNFLLHVWNHSVDGNGIQSWISHRTIYLSPEIGRITQGLGLQGELKVLQVRDGSAYLSTKVISPVGPLRC